MGIPFLAESENYGRIAVLYKKTKNPRMNLKTPTSLVSVVPIFTNFLSILINWVDLKLSAAL